MMNDETWKDIYFEENEIIYDFRGYYKISSHGRIMSLERYVIDKNGKKYKIKEKILKCHINKNGYTVATLMNKNIEKQFYVHRLVAIHFIPNIHNKPEVDHIIPISDGGTNYASNLRWATSKENTNNPFSKIKNDLSKIGRKHTEEQINKQKIHIIKDKVIGINGNDIKVFESAEEAKRNGFHHVSDCCRKIRKTSGGYEWFYLKDCPINIKELLIAIPNFIVHHYHPNIIL